MFVQMRVWMKIALGTALSFVMIDPWRIGSFLIHRRDRRSFRRAKFEPAGLSNCRHGSKTYCASLSRLYSLPNLMTLEWGCLPSSRSCDQVEGILMASTTAPTVVLVVEDEPLIRLAALLLVKSLGDRAPEAENADDAIAIHEWICLRSAPE